MDGCANTRPGSPMRDKITILRCLPAAHCLEDSTHPSFLSLLPRLLSRVTAHMVASLTFRVETPGLFHLCNDAHIVVTYTRLRPPPFAVAGSSIARRECRSIRDRRRKTERERKMRPAALFVACETYVASTPRCFLLVFPAKCHSTWPAWECLEPLHRDL